MISPLNVFSNIQEGRLAPTSVGQVFQSVLAGCLTSAPLVLLLFVLSAQIFAQDLPAKIRGYKVHSDKITFSINDADNDPSDASVKIGEPKIVEAALTGVTFELSAEVLAAKQSAKVDFLTFHEVRVNGISVDVEEYRNQFALSKGEFTALPKPARIFLPATGILQAAWKEMRNSQADWTVSGRVFVFGRFRKFGMYHKRVVPVDFRIKIKNPLSAS